MVALKGKGGQTTPGIHFGGSPTTPKPTGVEKPPPKAIVGGSHLPNLNMFFTNF